MVLIILFAVLTMMFLVISIIPILNIKDITFKIPLLTAIIIAMFMATYLFFISNNC